MEIPYEYLTEDEKKLVEVEKSQEFTTTIVETPKEDITQAEVTENTTEDTEQVSFTRADLEQKLKDAGIKFSHLSKDETLLQKCIENNLM